MIFDVKNKVALITGGASGIGLSHAKILLSQGAKGVVIADVDEVQGQAAVTELLNSFDATRILFVKTDVADKKSFENAFDQTIRRFKNIDILINNAGIMDEISWERCVDVNLKGTINGMDLAIEKYLKKYRQSEGVIINTSSIGGLNDIPIIPIYCSTKFGVVGITKTWGNPFHYEKTGIRVVAICPGFTLTTMIKRSKEKIRVGDDILSAMLQNLEQFAQSTDYVAEETLKVLKKAPTGTIWVIEENQPAYEFVLPDKKDFVANVISKY